MPIEGFEAIAGKWTLVKNEGFDEYLSAMGIGYIKRKIAGAASTTMEIIEEEGDQIRIITKGPKNTDTIIKVDESKEEVDPFDNRIKAKVTWNPVTKVMRSEADPVGDSKAKRTIVERKLMGDNELLMEISLPNENIVCKRYFKKSDS